MKIICIGRNYIDHAHELNNPVPTEPVIFMKPETALLKNNQDFLYPDFSNDIHHEIEVVLKMGKTGRDIESIGLGIDFTARDIQDDCKKKGLPWEKAKAFDHSAPISDFIPVAQFSDLNNISFYLTINDKKIQTGNTKDMIFSFDKLIAEISRYFTLEKDDLIFTGTPAGVGAVHRGDILTGFLENREMLKVIVR